MRAGDFHPRIAKTSYFSEVLTEVNTVFRLLPRPFTAAMMASAMPAAISPYSIAVAPDSSEKNFKTVPKAASVGVVPKAEPPWIYGTYFRPV
jgi:hypothetical protein